MLGGDLQYRAFFPPMRLKVAGIDLLAVGDTAPRGDDGRELQFLDPDGRKYRKLILQGSRLSGAIVVGHREMIDDLCEAVEQKEQQAGRQSAS